MTDTRVQRRLTTILVADVVGYSRLIGVAEAATLATVKDRWTRIIKPAKPDPAYRTFCGT